MCGIFFSIGFENLPSAVIDSVKHRGPDGRGWNEFTSPQGPVVMAHRRLAIVDLSDDGHQPMASEDGRYWVTYNGEIYNYLEIREELKEAGYTFKTQTDTEVLLKSYLHWGPDCLNKFNGMFAFVIWDDKEKKVFAARDRFGVKPLHYYQQGDKIAFTSEIKQFMCVHGFEARLNHCMAYHVFTSKLIQDSNKTIFKDVFQLLGGECFFLITSHHRTEISIKRWYDISKIKEHEINEEVAFSTFKNLFFDAINLRLRSDVPVGSCLSGGIDSSAIVSVLSKICDKDIDLKTFSACYKNDPLDESLYIDTVTSHTGIPNVKTYPAPDTFIDTWENMIYHHDAPLGGATAFAQNQVFKIAQEHDRKVMLDGQGADEVFAGYHSMFGALHYEYLSSLKILKFLSEIDRCKRTHGYPYKTLLIRMMETSQPDSLKRILSLIGKEVSLCPGYLNKDFFHQYNKSETLFWEQKLENHSLASPKTLNQLCLQKIKLSLPTLLHCEDRNSMMYSVESRVPFLDYRLVEFGLSLPSHLKISCATTKNIVRKSLKGILPNKIGSRQDKLGFAVPEVKWFQKKETRDKVRGIFNETITSFPELFQQGCVFPENTDNENSQFFDCFSVIDFGIFMKKFNVRV